MENNKLMPRRPVEVPGLAWSDYNHRAHTVDLEVARAADRALREAGFSLREACRLEQGIYWFRYLKPLAGLTSPDDGPVIGEVTLLALLDRDNPLPAQVVYRVEGDPVWHVPETVHGSPNYWGDEWQAAQFGIDLCSMDHPEAEEYSTWPMLQND